MNQDVSKDMNKDTETVKHSLLELMEKYDHELINKIYESLRPIIISEIRDFMTQDWGQISLKQDVKFLNAEITILKDLTNDLTEQVNKLSGHIFPEEHI